MARSHPHRSAQRRHSAIGYVLAGAALLAACGAPQAGPAPHRLVIAASATANEPAPALTGEAWSVVGAAIDSDAGTLDLVVDGPYGPEPVRTIDLVLRRDEQIEHAATRRGGLRSARLAEVDAAVHGLAGENGRIDVLALLGAVARVPEPATGVVISSGLQSEGPLGIQALRWDLVPDLPERAAAAGLLPDLTGKTIVFTGLGDVAGDQAPLTERLRGRLFALWLGICHHARAAACRIDTERARSDPPVSTAPAPRSTSRRTRPSRSRPRRPQWSPSCPVTCSSPRTAPSCGRRPWPCSATSPPGCPRTPRCSWRGALPRSGIPARPAHSASAGRRPAGTHWLRRGYLPST